MVDARVDRRLARFLGACFFMAFDEKEGDEEKVNRFANSRFSCTLTQRRNIVEGFICMDSSEILKVGLQLPVRIGPHYYLGREKVL